MVTCQPYVSPAGAEIGAEAGHPPPPDEGRTSAGAQSAPTALLDPGNATVTLPLLPSMLGTGRR